MAGGATPADGTAKRVTAIQYQRILDLSVLWLRRNVGGAAMELMLQRDLAT